MNHYKIYPKEFRNEKVLMEKKRCLFLMPFSDEFDIIYGSVKQYLTNHGYICNRVDEISGSTPIISKILNEILKSQYIIVDLTNNNPNVFYELGISHTLKDASSIILLKQNKSNVPFDITHLTYTEYDPGNLKLLSVQIKEVLDKNKDINELRDQLTFKNIIAFNDETEDFINCLNTYLKYEIVTLNALILMDLTNIDESKIKLLLNGYTTLMHNLINEKKFDTFNTSLKLFGEIIVCSAHYKTTENFLIDFIENFWGGHECSNDLIINSIMDLLINCAKNLKFVNISMEWLINYFKQTKSASVDLNRYKVESFLMTTKHNEINEIIINSLLDSDCHIREHMSDIIGEKKLYEAGPLLCIQLRKEKNIFTATSMIEAIGKTFYKNGIEIIFDWLKDHKREIIETESFFVLNHIKISLTYLDDSEGKIFIKEFDNDYGMFLKNYDIF